MDKKMPEEKNILGGILEPCSTDPVTGFLRNGCCSAHQSDRGEHVVCAIMTAEFLEFSKTQGNDLSTPRPEFNFPGLKEGDGWCVCALRWKEAYDAGVAPPIKPASTHERALEYIPLEALQLHILQ